MLRGPALEGILPAVALAHLREAALRVMPAVIQNALGDERNTLLTMSRILVTLEAGTIVSKEAAAAAIAPSLPQPDRGLLERARDGYLHGNDGDWTADATLVREVLQRLALRATDAHTGSA